MFLTRTLSAPLFCGAAFALAATATTQDRPAELRAPFVVSYSADGLRLTATLLNGLTEGRVGQRVNALRRERNPDWPPVTLSIEQEDADSAQPAGYFSGQLVLRGVPSLSDERADALLRAVVEALQDELQERMHKAPRETIDRDLAQARDAMASLEKELARVRDEMVQHADGHDDAAHEAARLRNNLIELEMQMRMHEPLVDVERRQAKELEDRMTALNRQRIDLRRRQAELERRAQRANEDDEREKISSEAAEVGVEGERLAQLLDHTTAEVQRAAAAAEERMRRVLEVKPQLEATRELIAQQEKLADSQRAAAARRAALEGQIEQLSMQLQRQRDVASELERRAHDATPVRVQLWR